MGRHDHCFGFEADFVGDLRCIPMAVRRKLDLVGIKLKLVHWGDLDAEERQRLLEWPDDHASLAALDHWLAQRTAAMAAGVAGRLEPACGAPWQRDDGPPEVLLASCRQLRLTYGRPFRVWLRLMKEHPIEEEVYLGDIPIMLGGGEFIINGAERVVVSQLHRSPGVDFVMEADTTSDRKLASCRIMSSASCCPTASI